MPQSSCQLPNQLDKNSLVESTPLQSINMSRGLFENALTSFFSWLGLKATSYPLILLMTNSNPFAEIILKLNLLMKSELILTYYERINNKNLEIYTSIALEIKSTCWFSSVTENKIFSSPLMFLILSYQQLIIQMSFHSSTLISLLSSALPLTNKTIFGFKALIILTIDSPSLTPFKSISTTLISGPVVWVPTFLKHIKHERPAKTYGNTIFSSSKK